MFHLRQMVYVYGYFSVFVYFGYVHDAAGVERVEHFRVEFAPSRRDARFSVAYYGISAYVTDVPPSYMSDAVLKDAELPPSSIPIWA